MNKLYSYLYKLLKPYKLHPLLDVILFVALTLIIHFSYRYWATIQYFPLETVMNKLHDYLSDRVFNQSAWFIQHILGMDVTTIGRTMYWPNQGYIGINHGCSGLKQILQISLLLLIFPGPWKHKLWYIPMGMIIIHLTNLFRIIGLAEVLVYLPDYWKFSHDNLFRPFFYVVIFTLWVIWVEKFMKKQKINLEK
ncbi:MAG: archaeosortase/exosortase family protein [Bacteroidales bacterium]|nr:archaeosortase/exosortase family protein [Bacteroidales bacterium]